MEREWNILVINLGSTSSKVAYCRNDKIIEQIELTHDTKELRELRTHESIVAFYRKIVEDFLSGIGCSVADMDAIAARGIGKWGSYRHGAYLLTPQVGDDCRKGTMGHQGLYASTVISDEFSREYGVPAYLYDVVPTDELPEIACIGGIANYRRRVASHTLNCRATARKAAEMLERDPQDSTFVVTHMGGGFCTLLYKDGVIIETYSADEGSFTPERAGRIPPSYVIDVCTNPKYSEHDIRRILKQDVGLFGHLGTSNCVEVERRINDGDKKAELVYQAMAYQVSKDICSLGAVVCGDVDAIILTGGIARSAMFTAWIKKRVEFMAPVMIIPGSMETEALAGGVTRVLRGEEPVNSYEDVREHFLFEDLENQ
jgi:butyrate kinase